MTLCDVILNLLLAFIAVVGALWYEALGVPRLIIEAGSTTDDVKPDGRRTRFLHLNVRNAPRKAPFVARQTAVAAHGTITFLDVDGGTVTGAMPIRWDGAPEPIKYEVVNGQIATFIDPRLLRISRFIDIFPDETESLAIAVRILGDHQAFGWTGESYVHDWRHPDFRLPQGTLTARIRLATGDNVVQQDFRLANPPDFGQFDLMPPGDA